MRISVLGLGKMGAPIARNLIEVGHEITLYNRNPERAAGIATGGVRVAATVAEAARDAHVALTMLSDDDAENALTFGTDGLLAHLPQGSIHLCMSTIGMETSRKLALAHAEAGQGYVAAPVFGRPGTAVSRHLWIVVGGPEAQVMRCMSIFDSLGRGVTKVGPRAELAHALKVGGSMLTFAMVEGLSEVLTYGEKAGMAPAEYLRLLNTAIFKSPMMDALGGMMVRRSHEPADLTLDSGLKDVQQAMQAAETLDSVMPLAELLHQRFEVASVQGLGGQDITALSRSCRIAAGLEVRQVKDEFENARTENKPSTFIALSRDGEVELDLKKITHFEIIKNAVWAWTQGTRYRTPWRHLAEVERTFGHIPFLRLHRHILLQPEAALAVKALPSAAMGPLLEKKMDSALPEDEVSPGAYSAETDERRVTLELAETSHFELEKDIVWAWSQGKRYRTAWRSLAEIESVFKHVLLVRIQREILLYPESVLSLKPVFGGRAKVRVAGDLELNVSRATASRLKELLGV